MTFKVPAPVIASDPAARFEFTLPGSKKKWGVPLLKYMPVETAEAIFKAKRTSQIIDALFGGRDEPLAQAIYTLTPDQIDAVIRAWGEASGISVGESKASSSS